MPSGTVSRTELNTVTDSDFLTMAVTMDYNLTTRERFEINLLSYFS